MKGIKVFLILTLILSVSLSCDKSPTNVGYQKEIVVLGYLWGNKPLDVDHAIMISHTKPIDTKYNLDDALIPNAVVTL